MAEAQTLPEFSNPPVTEVVLGVQFEPLIQWSVPQFGLYWAAIRAEYPLSEVQPPLLPQIEVFGTSRFRPSTSVEINVASPDIRCWFSTADHRRLVQVQKDRFLVNWRKADGEDIYPRYEPDIRPKFKAEYERFTEQLSTAGVDSLRVTQCEITYVNEIEKGTIWDSFADLGSIVRPWSGMMTDQFLPSPETLQINVAYPLPDECGRLHVAVQHAFRMRDSHEMLQLRLTARGKPTGNEIGGILKWFDMGREWIVRGFADFTANQAQAYWKRSC